MKFTAMVVASVFALSGTSAFAHTVRHKSNVRTHTMYGHAAPSVILHPKYGSLNENDPGGFRQTPAATQSFDDPEGKDSGLSLP